MGVMDWARGHGPISGTANGFLVTVAATVVANAVGSPAWLMAALGLTGAAALAADAHMGGRAARTIVYRASVAAAAGGYSAAVLVYNPVGHGFPDMFPALGKALLAGVALTAIAAALARSCANAERREAAKVAGEARRLSRFANEETRIARRWEDLISKVTGAKLPTEKEPDGLVCRGVRFWDDRAGYDLDIDLPADGTNFDSIKRGEASLNAAARLPHGCSAEVLRGANQGCVVISVSTVNRLGDEEIPYPTDCPMRTINNPQPFGMAMSGAELALPMRQTSTVVIGDQGSGKTTTGNVVIARTLECVDVINLAIDLNGGAVAIPWMVAARILGVPMERAPFAAIAATPDVAVRMTNWVIRVLRDRKSSSAMLKYTSNETLLPVSPGLPYFNIVCDEVASYLGAGARDDMTSQLCENLEIIQNEGRDSGARLTLLGLAATEDVVSRMMLGGCGNKIALRLGKDAEYDYLFDWKSAANKADIDGKAGMAWYSIHGSPVRRGKIMNIRPTGIETVVRLTTNRRPAPDPRALALSEGFWERRWEDAAGILDRIDQDVERATGRRPAPVLVGAAPAAGAGTRPTPPPAQRVGRMDDAGTTGGDAMKDLDAAMTNLGIAGEELARAVAAADGDDPDRAAEQARFTAMIAADPDLASLDGVEVDWSDPAKWPTGAEGRPTDPTETADSRRTLLLVIRQFGPISAGEVHAKLAELGVVRTTKTVFERLRKEKAAGTVEQPSGRGGPYVEGPRMVDIIPR